ncbi:MAG: choice-of-anchor Q domain-containing protein [Rubrobacteraceae bacterium]
MAKGRGKYAGFWGAALRLVVVVVIAVILAGTLGAGDAAAASFTVTNTNDSGPGSLRNAIDQANTTVGTDTIEFAAGLSGTIPLTGGQLSITDDVEIEGPGPDQLSVSGTNSSRVFFLNSGVTVGISGLTITGGDGVSSGGGIENRGPLTLTDSVVTGNSAGDNGGGINNGFGGILTVEESTISGNTAADGGGIANSRGTLTVASSTISGNTVGSFGGGILNGGLTEISDSTISGNTSGVFGGGIATFGTLRVDNSTISGNTADDDGGGINNRSGLTEINFSTITENTAPEGQGSGVASLGNTTTSTGVFSSIIAGNEGSDVDFVRGTTNTFASEGYNLVGDGNATPAFNNTGDQVIGNAGPGLGPLKDNGGPTRTHAVRSGSPALDAGSPNCPPPATDQRGVSRPRDGDGNGTSRCDSGSFEKKPPASPGAKKANLSLTKKAGKRRPTMGTRLAYTLRVKNNGPNRATRVKIVDTLPKGVKVLSTSRGCKKVSGRKVRCYLAKLADGRSATRQIVVRVNKNGRLVNRAKVGSSVKDPNGKNNNARAIARAKAGPKPKPEPRSRLVNCNVKDPTVKLARGEQVVVTDRKPGKSVACVIGGNQLALARSLKNQQLGLVNQGGKQVKASKGKVVKAGARKVLVRVPGGF